MIIALLLAPVLSQTALSQTATPRCGPPPRGSRAWVSASDYPEEARRDHMRGNVVFDLDVSLQGCPVACRIVKSSGYSLLDDKTCALVMERARFSATPEQQAAGKIFTIRKTMMWAEQ